MQQRQTKFREKKLEMLIKNTWRGLVTTTFLNTKNGVVKNKIPDTCILVTTTVLYTKIWEVESKIPDVFSLVKKTVYKAKIWDIEKKYFSTFNYNKFTSEILDTKVKKD